MKKLYKANYYKWREEQGFVIVSNCDLEVFFLDNVSANILRILQTPKSIEETVDIMISDLNYDVDKSILTQDIQDLFDLLFDRKLVEV